MRGRLTHCISESQEEWFISGGRKVEVEEVEEMDEEETIEMK